jgi:hypothetical protein
MKPLRIALLALTIAAAGTAASAQNNPSPAPVSPPAVAPPSMGPTGSMPMHHPAGMYPMAGRPGHEAMGGMMAHQPGQQSAVPTEPGQAAFGAIQQIVGILQADPQTDWSKVDVDALREHLIDMDEVTMRAAVRKEPIENGLRIKVTGGGRTLEAIQRMVPEHARDIDGMYGWTVRTTAIPDGVELTVTTGNAADVRKIRALGFMGIMVQGSHHQMHHLAVAKGEPMHMR